MKIHKTCDSLSIFSFEEILKTKDYRHLFINYKKYRDIELNEEQKIDFEKVFIGIFYEYSELTFNKKILKNYKMQIEIELLEYRYSTTVRILQLYAEYGNIEVLGLLPDLDWSLNIEKEIEPQIVVIQRKLKFVKNKIKIQKIKYSDLYKDTSEKAVRNINKEALVLELNLGLNRSINPKLTSVVEWVNLINLNNEKKQANG